MKHLWLILFIIILGSCDERIEYSLITTVIPPEGGIVNPSSGTYKENADLSVTATPDSTYVFSGWSGSVTSNDNPLSLTMDSDKNLTATFVKNLRLLVLNISGEGLVEKRVDGNLVNDSLFVVGQTIELTAVTGEGYEFSGWSGSIISTDNPLTLTMDVNKELSAKFISTIVYCDKKSLEFFEGKLDGTISQSEKGEGWGYDPIFIPIGHKKTLAEMSNKEKYTISHRSLAINKFINFLSN